MRKNFFKIVAMTLVMVMTMGACGKKQTDNTTGNETSTKTVDVETVEPTETVSTEKKDIKFYGKIVEYTSGEGTCEKLQEKLSDSYNIESLQVDWNNIEQVIRTGIASGEPSDVYNYWPIYLRPFVDEGMALDLTPYLDANDGEWRKTFNPELLNLGNFDGKVYGITTTINFRAMIVNADLFKENNIPVPEGDFWSWDDFLAACKTLKGAGVFPVAAPVDNMKSDWFLGNGMISNAAEANKLQELADGKVSCLDPIVEGSLTKTKGLYDNKYMYPGDGAVTLTTDESRAAFYQKKVAITCEVAAGIGTIMKDADFDCVIVPWPAMSSVSRVQGGGDGLFIPANCKDPEAAVEVLKAYTAADVQQINVDQGYPVSNIECISEDPIVAKINEVSGSVYPYELKSLSPELSDYINNVALAELVLGGGVEATAQAMEDLRIAATK